MNSATKLRLLLTPALALTALATQGRALAQQGPFLTAEWVQTAPADDPNSPLWANAAVMEAPMIPQAAAMPQLRQVSVSKVAVRALHDADTLAILLEWQDASRDVLTGHPDQFRDAAAVMMPVQDVVPNICMGAAGQITNLWHWKADWQEDIDKGRQDVIDAYPNFFKDSYPFVAAEAKPPFRWPQDFMHPDAKNYSPGWAAGNPLSEPVRSSPVEELVSQGFGTATHKDGQQVTGRGVWENGTWKVVFARALKSPDAESPELTNRKEIPVAFAVWNGANKEVGARKQLSSFLTLAVTETPPNAPRPQTAAPVAPTAAPARPAPAPAAAVPVIPPWLQIGAYLGMFFGLFGSVGWWAGIFGGQQRRDEDE